jgi:hypothetical protein
MEKQSDSNAVIFELYGAHRALVGKPEGRRPLDPEVDGRRIILKWILERLDGGTG